MQNAAMANKDAFIEEIRVVSRFSNIKGIYVRHRTKLPDNIEEPVYCARRGKGTKDSSCFLFHSDGCFLLGPDLGFKRTYCRTEKDPNCDPTSIASQPEDSDWSKYIVNIEAVHHGGDADAQAPQRLEVHSRYGNLREGLRRQPDSDLVWAADSGKMFLWYFNAKDTWHLSEGPPDTPGARKQYASVAAKKSRDPRLGDWGATDGKIESLSAVWWEEQESLTGWKDPAFPPKAVSVGKPPTDTSVMWVRAPHLNRDPSHSCLIEHIDPSSLRQGHLGDCWLLAAIAAVSHFPEKIEALFPEGRSSLPKDGRHEVFLFDIVKGSWVKVIVDDFIPCKPRKWFELHASPLFSQPVGNEMWVLLLEKAFAKMWGGYHKLTGGRAAFAWQALTGIVEQKVLLRVGGSGATSFWEEYDLDVDDQKRQRRKGNLYSLPLCKAINAKDQVSYNSSKLWRHLEAAVQRGNVMAASFDHDGTDTGDVRDNGLMADHAYSLMEIVQVEDFRLVQLRNPFGSNIEWNGAWGDHDVAWTEHPEIAEELDFVAADDGSFYMLFDDFMAEFDTVSICPCTSGAQSSASLVTTDPTKRRSVAARRSCMEIDRREGRMAPSHWDTGSRPGSAASSYYDGPGCSERCADSCTML